MKKALFLLFVFFGIAYASSERISQIHFEIKSLEDQKPILFKIIQTCNAEMPPIKNSLNEVKAYRKKVDAAIDQNVVNTVISGGINVGFEVLGGFSGGKFVELGAWIAGKAIGVGMEKSSTFGGVSYYKSKVDGVSQAYQNLTPELKKLSQIAKSSDEAMKSYYNKYGKYKETFGLGDAGVFTTRMRLIVEQADVAILALETLHLHLFRTEEDAQRDLRNLERQIQVLREELEQLNQQEKEEKPKKEENKTELSKEDYETGLLPEIKAPSAQLPNMPQSCYKTYKNKQEVEQLIKAEEEARKIAEGINESVKDTGIQRAKAQSDYLNAIQEQYSKIVSKYNKGTFYQYSLAGSAHEDVKQGRFPTGYPFQVFLKDTQDAGDDLIKRTQVFIQDLEELTNTMLEGLPTNYDETLAQLVFDRDSYIARFYAIRTECLQGNTRELGFRVNGYPDSIASSLKGLKQKYLQELEKLKKQKEEFVQWHNERMSTLRTYFAKRRSEMAEEIAKYEKELAQQDAMRSKILKLAQKAIAIYSGNEFIKKDSSYIYIPRTKMQESVCETIKSLRSEFESGIPANVIKLEKDIKNLLKMERYYTPSGFPLDAYVEFGVDVAKLQDIQAKKSIEYSQEVQFFNTSGSSLQNVKDDLDNNKFYQLGLFYPDTIFKQISDKQMRALQDIKSLIKNFKLETKNLLDSSRVSQDAKENFKSYIKNIEKVFKENFGCLALDHQMIDGLVDEIEDLKSVLSKIDSKQTYINASSLFSALQELSNTIDNFGIDLDSPEKFLKDYQAIKDEYERLYTLINTTYANTLFEVDKRKLNEELLKIEPKFSAYEEHKKFLSQQDGNSIVEELYKNFAQEYSNKNLSSLMSLISDEWQSQSDGTTLMDLEDTLGNSFSIFNEVNCNISSLNIQNVSSNLYRVNYVITIVGLIYENDIKHEEKSSVYEEVRIENGRAKISKTLNGRFWQER